MAVRRRPLSKQVISTLRAKAKGRKNITLGMLKKVYRRGQGAFLYAGSRPRWEEKDVKDSYEKKLYNKRKVYWDWW